MPHLNLLGIQNKFARGSFVSDFSHQQIAKALNASTPTVRRIVDTAVADRRLDAPKRFARVQVARLSKARSHADDRLERGDIRAFTPYLKIVAALDRYHRIAARGLPQRLEHTEDVLSAPPPMLAPPRPRRPTPGRPRKLQILAPNALKSLTRRRIRARPSVGRGR